MRCTHKRGFTLIELLIVIAIILVLIAMALPNFLEAQLRARVTSAQGSMKSTATALEAYSVDWRGRYPWGASLEDLGVPMIPPEEGFEAHLPAILTTPIAYMTELLPDPFTNLTVEGSDHELPAPFHYNEETTLESLGEPTFLTELSLVLYGQARSGGYYMFSHGPDGDHDESLDRSEAGKETCRYSPTNGTKSNGDIYYFGPGVGFN